MYKDDSVMIDCEKQSYEILDGSSGTYDLNNIKKVRVASEIAKFRGKSEPFVHQFLGGTSFFTTPLEPKLYVGVKITTKDDKILAIYVTKNPVIYNSDLYLNDEAIAKKIVKKLSVNL